MKDRNQVWMIWREKRGMLLAAHRRKSLSKWVGWEGEDGPLDHGWRDFREAAWWGYCWHLLKQRTLQVHCSGCHRPWMSPAVSAAGFTRMPLLWFISIARIISFCGSICLTTTWLRGELGKWVSDHFGTRWWVHLNLRQINFLGKISVR